VLLGVPNGGTIKGALFPDLVAEMFGLSSVVQWLLADLTGTLGPHNRWLAGRQAINAECDYLWLVDNDMRIPNGTFARLWAADKDIIGAAYNYRKTPLQSVVTMLTDHGTIESVSLAMMPNEPFVCHSIGSGCKLIKVSALKKIPQPWFALEWGANGELTKTDDRWFCEQAAKVGIETWCDPTLEVKHVGDYNY
jgi:hypothetical protein